MAINIKLKLTVYIYVLLALSGQVKAQDFMTNVDGRARTSLNGEWQVIVDWYGTGNSKKIYLDQPVKNKTAFNEYSFSDLKLKVPGDWNSQKANLAYYEGMVWYKKEFTYHLEDNERVFLHFGAINYTANVYLNGKLLGQHEGGFTPFQFEVTDKIKEGTNKIIINVDNKRKEEGIPALSFDWWNYGGITRDVNLIKTPKSFIQDYFIQLKKGSTKQIDGWIKINGNQGAEEISINVTEAKIRKRIKTDENGYAAFSFEAKLELWSPDNPKLYQVELLSAADKIKEQIGFRNIEVKGEDIFLNGKSVFLKGISFHEEIVNRRAVSADDALVLLSRAKELGCNFIRLSHYPQNEYILRLADQMGLMVWEEIPVWQGIDFNNPIILNKAEFMLKEMIARDKNRCGLIIWSLSNETRPGPVRNEVLTALAKLSRKLDPTRLISSAYSHFKYDGNKIIIDDPLSESLDILAANKYMGWYTPWPAEPANMIWETKFKKPMILSEFGAEALFGNHGAADIANLWTEEYQEKVIRDNLAMINQIPFLKGVCPWILADFRSPFRMQATFQDGWNRKGLLSEKGEKKKAWYVINDFYKTIKNK